MRLRSIHRCSCRCIPKSLRSRRRPRWIQPGDFEKVVCAVDSQGRVTINGVPVYRIGPELRAANDAYDRNFRRKDPAPATSELCPDCDEVTA
jgi:hypothetical protein